MTRFIIRPLAATHNRIMFNSSSAQADNYLRRSVTKDIRRRISACFVAQADDPRRLAGYYTLASTGVCVAGLASDIVMQLPRQLTVPAVIMTHLAVDKEFTRQGLGGALLADAISRVYNSDVNAYALVVDGKNETGMNFYCHHGFIAFPEASLTLFLPLATMIR